MYKHAFYYISLGVLITQPVYLWKLSFKREEEEDAFPQSLRFISVRASHTNKYITYDSEWGHAILISLRKNCFNLFSFQSLGLHVTKRRPGRTCFLRGR